MLRALPGRLLTALLLLWIVLTLTFILLHLAPGDPTRLLIDPRVSPAQQQAMQHALGLDQSVPRQYARWLGAVVLHGDWGTSFSRHEPASMVIRRALPATLLLTVSALLIQYLVGIGAGVIAARYRYRWVDHAVRLSTQTLYSLPVFWIGLMAILLFSQKLGWLPSGGMRSPVPPGGWRGTFDLISHLPLPAAVLGIASAGRIARLTRNELLDFLQRDFIRTARAKGASERRVLLVHALRNTAPTLAHAFGVSLPILLSGALVTEVVFAWPGLGRVTYGAILSRDYPLILATTAMTGALVVAGSFIAEWLHVAADPRLRDG
jgi:peptide/nickel transport system permease protein